MTAQRKTVVRLVALVAVMGGLSFAAVPFYDWFCRVTGYGGAPAVADGRGHEILDQKIRIRFDANTAAGMPWEFRPAVREIELRIGETVVRLVALVAVMGGLSFAAVPFYDWFCRVTGYGGAPAIADGRGHEILEQKIRIRFDANTAAGMPWEFRPAVREIELRIGETGLAFYTAHNPTDRPVAGTAGYNVAPYSAGGYFTKIDCFCFNEQILQPGETVEMPVTFYVDPEIVEDREARHVTTITLSYTFYEIDMPETDPSAAELTDARTGANESGTVGLN